MRSIEARAGWRRWLLQLFCGTVSSLYLAAPTHAVEHSDLPPLLDSIQVNPVLGHIVLTSTGVDTADLCSSVGAGKLVELDAFSGKMLNCAVLDTNGDGGIDSTDTLSSGVIFSGGIPAPTAIIDDATGKIVNDSSGGISTLVEKPGGASRRIMWRQIQ